MHANILAVFSILGAAALFVGCGSSDDKDDGAPASGGDDSAGGAAAGGNGGTAGSLGAAGAGGARTCEQLRAELDVAFATAVQQEGFTGAAAEVRSGECVWQGAAGLADVAANIPVQPDDLFWVSSVTKSFVATVAVMLHREGGLSLDDPVSDYVSSITNGENITIRHVLNHTSGLPMIHPSAEPPEDDPEAAPECARYWAPEEIVALAMNDPSFPMFSPGEGFWYSNANYQIAGLVIEAVTGNSLASEIRSRILEPLGLESTYLVGGVDEPEIPGLVKGYVGENGSGCGDQEFIEPCDPANDWAAAGLVSNSRDLNAFYHALLSGQLVDAEGLSAMLQWVFIGGNYPFTLGPGDYGLGLMRDRAPLGTMIGHVGGGDEFQTTTWHTPDADIHVTLTVNCGSGNSWRSLINAFYALRDPLGARRADPAGP